MRNRVMEGGRNGVCEIKLLGRPMGHKLALCVLAGCTLLASTAVAQTEDRAEGFRATVLDVSSDSRSVTVPLDRSVIIKTTVEIARADVTASHIADVQPVSATELLIMGKSYGHTNVILWDEREQRYVLDVAVELDLEQLNEAFPVIDPQSNVQAKSVLGNIVLTGTVSSAERAKRMVELAQLFLPVSDDAAPTTAVQNHLDVAGEQQVLLRCVVAEVSRSAIRELGVDGFLAGDNFRDMFTVSQIAGVNPINIGAAADALVNQRIPFLTGPDGIPLLPESTFSLGFPRAQLQLFIRAMAENSLLHVLAEPNLVAISGETASFLAGGEFPVPVPQGIQQVTIEFREFGVRLNFTPIVKGHQRIRLRVAPEISELDFTTGVQVQGLLVPGLTTRSAETTVEIGNGQTIVIAGLLSEQIRGIARRLPGIGDVPVLGALFRSVKFQRSVTELVILVTPEIVAPLDAHQRIPLPTDGSPDPNDFDLYMLGLLEGAQQAEASNPSEAGIGDELVSRLVLPSEPDELSIHGPWGHAIVTD